MASPESKTLQTLVGEFKLNEDLSDDFTQVLGFVGVNMLIQKASGAASVYLKIQQPSHDEIKMEQTAMSAAVPGLKEDYKLDWQWRAGHDPFFGDVETRCRWLTQEEAKEIGADGQWSKDDSEGKLIQAMGKPPHGGWTATHWWGFEAVSGARRHTRYVEVVGRDGKEIKVRMVYDFEGE